MKLAVKQLIRLLLRERVFTVLLFLMALLTSVSFFFVRFSIDGNMSRLKTIPSLKESQRLFKKAMESNASLALAFLAALTFMTAFVIVLFFYRFFRANSKQLGCLISLGFRDLTLRAVFCVYTTAVCFAGGLSGLAGGYFLSDVLIQAYMQSYSVEGLVRAVNATGIFSGLLLPVLIFSAVSALCYGFVSAKQPGMLLSGKHSGTHMSLTLKLADKITSLFPLIKVCAFAHTSRKCASKADRHPSLRIALRKPLAVFFIFLAVITFHVFFMLGHSLNKSSERVYEMQTAGRSYEYDTHYSDFRTVPAPSGSMAYIDAQAFVHAGGQSIAQTAAGFYQTNGLFRLLDASGNQLPPPEPGAAYITPGLAEMYDIRVDGPVILEIAGQRCCFHVSKIAWNGKTNTIYCNPADISLLTGAPDGAYNGVVSNAFMPDGGLTLSKTERLDALKRDAVSNRVSAVINQLTGVLIGCILIFLALYLNFEDNRQDMLILDMLGLGRREISRLLVNVYGPVTWAAFILTWPMVFMLTRRIHKSLSLMTGDYMPFGTGPLTALYAFILLNVIYLLAQAMLSAGIGRVLKKGNLLEMTAL